jgi:hypothetical protein
LSVPVQRLTMLAITASDRPPRLSAISASVDVS